MVVANPVANAPVGVIPVICFFQQLLAGAEQQRFESWVLKLLPRQVLHYAKFDLIPVLADLEIPTSSLGVTGFRKGCKVLPVLGIRRLCSLVGMLGRRILAAVYQHFGRPKV